MLRHMQKNIGMIVSWLLQPFPCKIQDQDSRYHSLPWLLLKSETEQNTSQECRNRTVVNHEEVDFLHFSIGT